MRVQGMGMGDMGQGWGYEIQRHRDMGMWDMRHWDMGTWKWWTWGSGTCGNVGTLRYGTWGHGDVGQGELQPRTVVSGDHSSMDVGHGVTMVGTWT